MTGSLFINDKKKIPPMHVRDFWKSRGRYSKTALKRKDKLNTYTPPQEQEGRQK